MKIVVISDTHERHDEIVMPDGDVLVHAGDATGNGKWPAIEKFLRWMDRQPHEHKIFVAGNHDFCFENDPSRARQLVRDVAPNVKYLQDQATVIDGVRFYGSPWTPRFYDWAFNLNRHAEMAEKWAMIPDDTEVLVTHGPPFEVLDWTPSGRRAGCEALAERIPQLPQIKLHIFGHIHHSYGVTERGGVTYVNACICDEGYLATRAPIILDL